MPVDLVKLDFPRECFLVSGSIAKLSLETKKKGLLPETSAYFPSRICGFDRLIRLKQIITLWIFFFNLWFESTKACDLI